MLRTLLGARGVPRLSHDSLDGLPQNGRTDPIEYYKRPLVGYLFRERINMALRMLGGRRFRSLLEVGYGAGAVLVALAPHVDAMAGIDLDAEPEIVERALRARGLDAQLLKGSVYEMPYAEATFDLVVSFSVFEHLSAYETALAEVSRVLAPGGHFLLGMPAVNRTMSRLFELIGHRDIDDDHVTTPAQVARTFSRHGLRVEQRTNLGVPGGGPALYYSWLLKRV